MKKGGFIMPFSEYKYIRPNQKDVEKQLKEAVENFNCGKTLQEQEQAMQKINAIRNDVATMENLCSIRHTIDTTDEFYKDEQDFFDEFSPHLQGYVTNYYQALVSSPFRAELEQKYGKQLFTLAELELKTYDDAVLEELQQENRLTSQYTKLIASAKIPFQGEEYTLAQLKPFTENSDREVRKAASAANTSFFVENQEELDRIFDQLVKIRTTIAKKLGFPSFVELGYARMVRADYDRKMVENFRKQVEELIVPLATKLKERQRSRIGVDILRSYDEGFEFINGNATPKGNADWIMKNGVRMYEELSPETKEFFDYMNENQLLDLLAKKGKAGGGYCTYIENYQAPFIFANFNGTSDDIDVLTHEAGHAFQVYSSRHFEIPEYLWPTFESCEIHSMSMEFFTYPWMEKFFEEDTEKYYFSHLSSALTFLPYGVAVDEFQHRIYSQPDLTPQERHSVWREMEKKYLPHRQYGDNEYLEKGGYWQRQGHIYEAPFYYIDYTLAQICAFQFWKRMNENREEAWHDYVKLCKEGGSKSFLQLVETANLISPFEDGCVESVVGFIEGYLNSIDDRNL